MKWKDWVFLDEYAKGRTLEEWQEMKERLEEQAKREEEEWWL